VTEGWLDLKIEKKGTFSSLTKDPSNNTQTPPADSNIFTYPTEGREDQKNLVTGGPRRKEEAHKIL